MFKHNINIYNLITKKLAFYHQCIIRNFYSKLKKLKLENHTNITI